MSTIAPGRTEVTTGRTEVTTDRTGVATQAIEESQSVRLAPNYWPFVVPALVVVSAVIVFPWAFTLWMSVNRWTLGQSRSFAAMENYLRLASDPRFWESLVHTLTYTSLSVAA
ncbi:MAG: sugar ABC transporter permease, partial [Mesorhizobium sp.]